jgi:hypothetical protein
MIALSALVGSMSCAGQQARRLALPAEPSGAVATGGQPAADPAGEEVFWGLPPEAASTQRIVKLHYQGPDGDATLNLVLRLVDERRFSLQGNDQLGRSWFRLAVEDSRALFLDLRGKTFCRFEESIEIDAVPLGPLPFDQLPALLLGRLPVAPVERMRTSDDGWRVLDAAGREWTAEVPGGELARWILWRNGEPEVWWQRSDSLVYLSARAEGLQLRWRTPPGQPLARDPAGLEVPEGFAASRECAEARGDNPSR